MHFILGIETDDYKRADVKIGNFLFFSVLFFSFLFCSRYSIHVFYNFMR